MLFRLFALETESCCVVQAGSTLSVLYLGSQAYTTTSSSETGIECAGLN